MTVFVGLLYPHIYIPLVVICERIIRINCLHEGSFIYTLGASHKEPFIYMYTRSVTYRTVHLHVYSKRHTNNRSSTCLLGASHTEHFIYILVASYNILLLIRLNCTAHPFLYIFREKSDKDPSHKRVYCTVSVY